MNASFKKSTDKMTLWREHPSEMVRDLFHIEPDPWQVEALEAFPRHPRLAMKAPIDCEAMVPTPRGTRKWGTIKPGQVVFAQDGSIAKVKSRFDVGVVPMYRVTFRDGTSLRVSADHEWDIQTPYDRKDGRGVRTVSTSTLATMNLRSAKTGQRLISIPPQGPAQYPVADLPADPYIFGLWLGDGIANESRLICPDLSIRAEILLRGQTITTSSAVTKRIGLPRWGTALRATGASTCRSFEKYIPERYKHASVSQRLDLLRGLMDSDGTVAKNGHSYLASCSKKLIDDFIWLARSLGYVAKQMGPYRINGGENRDSYRAVICGQICPFLADTRKLKRWKCPVFGKSLRFIDSVEPDGEAEAMCIEIDHHSHCFLATDFIVTHNCKGPGKTALEAWIGWNFLLTRPYPKCAATSISGQNLKDNFWAEMAKWQSRSPMLMKAFEWTAQRISYRKEPENWFMSARTWPQSADSGRQADTLAGFHADYVLFILDESGGIPSAVMVSAEAALSSCIEGHIVQAGNPTMLSGPLYAACTTERRLWKVIEITGDPDDPRRSTRINVQWARDQIEKYGRDNPWVLVNVFGQFPPSSLNVLIGPDEVTAAMNRGYKEYDIGKASKIMGVDVARYGDDSSVIARRQGVQMFNFDKKRNLESTQGAGWVSRTWDEWGAHACFIDMTGGHGAGWYDQLRVLGKAPIGVQYAGEPHEKSRYHNKRAEMAFDFVNWIKNGGALPNSPELMAALTQTTYTFHKDRFLLQPKDEVKLAIGYSPDEFDAAMQTFAEPVTPPAAIRRATPMRAAYNPFTEMDGDSGGQNQYGGRHRSDYNPFQGD